jgi:hypothetical protein
MCACEYARVLPIIEEDLYREDGYHSCSYIKRSDIHKTGGEISSLGGHHFERSPKDGECFDAMLMIPVLF